MALITAQLWRAVTPERQGHVTKKTGIITLPPWTKFKIFLTWNWPPTYLFVRWSKRCSSLLRISLEICEKTTERPISLLLQVPSREIGHPNGPRSEFHLCCSEAKRLPSEVPTCWQFLATYRKRAPWHVAQHFQKAHSNHEIRRTNGNYLQPIDRLS